jgi:protein-S-isoprenylcysteine O-methyltransferase Ste14
MVLEMTKDDYPPKAPKDTPGVIVLPPVLFAVPLVAGYLLNRWFPLADIPEWAATAGLALLVLSLIPGPWALVEMLRRGVNPEPYVPVSHLVTGGPFRFSRNPIYLTYVLFVAGMGLFLCNAWMLVLLIPTVIVAHYGIILREERYLSRRFGAPYDTYMQRVRRWL